MDDELWHHGTEDSGLTEFQKLKHVRGLGNNGADAGVGTYATRDLTRAMEHAFGFEVDPRGGSVPHPDDTYAREEWLDRAKIGRVLSAQFRPKNPTHFQDIKTHGPEFDQAEAARAAGHDAISWPGGNVVVSFRPHKNLSVVSVNTFSDLNPRGMSPEQYLRDADEHEDWNW